MVNLKVVQNSILKIRAVINQCIIIINLINSSYDI